MKIFIIAALIIIGVTALILLVLHIKTGKVFKSLLLHAAIGLILFAAIDLAAPLTGIKIPVNLYSVTSAAVLGAPAVCGFLIINLIL